MRIVTPLNRDWFYTPDFSADYLDPGYPLGSWRGASLPHANLELPLNGFDERSYQFVSAYARDLALPAFEAGSRLFLDFEGVMTSCTAWLDGVGIGSHEGGYTPFSFEISGIARPSSIHRLLLRVDSRESPEVPPFGKVVDYLCYGGIYREASLRMQGPAFIRDVHAVPSRVLESRKAVESVVELDRRDVPYGECAIVQRLRAVGRDGAVGRAIAEAAVSVEAEARAPDRHSLRMDGLEGMELWDTVHPALYELTTELVVSGVVADSVSTRVGFRAAEWKPEGFFLNGELLKIIGLNRHQAWPYSGYAMPARAQRRDAEILKRELGVNLVRTSHYPQSRHFLDACDELGLLVFEELPGWQHIGGEAWKDNACASLADMIVRDRNRPSVVLWGVRINESADDHEFFARTNAIARELDPGRSRGGVRCIERSKLLEDVYTFNDFAHNGGSVVLRDPRRVTGLGRDVPYIVTEHNGHMYPTKRFDNEQRLMEHALRHARVLDAAFGRKGIAGAIGWCAFDYNTHKDFGSGDRICYHGVSDIFRVPKYAAFAYASQVDPAERVVLEAASLFAKGERDAAKIVPVYVFTNCDGIELWRGSARVGTYLPARDEFPHLPHPPVAIRDLIGDQLSETPFRPGDRLTIRRIAAKALSEGFENLSWLDRLRMGLLLLRYRMREADMADIVYKYAVGWGREDERFEIVGMIGGKEVARRVYGGDAHATRLEARADDDRLSAGDWDTTRVVLKVLDQYGNVQPFVTDAVEIRVTGPASVMGPSRFALAGGCGAFWVRSSGEPGTIGIAVESGRFAAIGLELAVGG